MHADNTFRSLRSLPPAHRYFDRRYCLPEWCGRRRFHLTAEHLLLQLEVLKNRLDNEIYSSQGLPVRGRFEVGEVTGDLI